MKKSYLITVDVVRASGFQQFTVQAESEVDAVKEFNCGNCKFIGQEIDVSEIGEPMAELNE